MWKMMVEYVARDRATSQSVLETGVVGGMDPILNLQNLKPPIDGHVS